MNKVYNSRFAPEFGVSMLKETIALVCVQVHRKSISTSHKYMALQCSKLFYSKVFGGFLRQGSQSSYSFGKIRNVGGLELSEEKTLVFHWRKISYFVFTYIFSASFPFYFLVSDIYIGR